MSVKIEDMMICGILYDLDHNKKIRSNKIRFVLLIDSKTKKPYVVHPYNLKTIKEVSITNIERLLFYDLIVFFNDKFCDLLNEYVKYKKKPADNISLGVAYDFGSSTQTRSERKIGNLMANLLQKKFYIKYSDYTKYKKELSLEQVTWMLANDLIEFYDESARDILITFLIREEQKNFNDVERSIFDDLIEFYDKKKLVFD